MMNMIGRRDVMAGVGASALMLPGGWCANAQETPRRGGTLSVGLVQDNTKTLDPRLGNQIDERQLMFLIYNTLLAIDSDFSLKPELAKSWSIEDSGKRYVFQLQEGIKFQDGTPFDSAAVKWNIEQRLDETVKSPQRAQLRPVIGSVDVLSQTAVAVNLNIQYPALLAEFADRAGAMMSPAAAAKYGADFGRNPVGTGPFILKQWVQGTQITLARNSDYWRAGEPYLDSIVFRTVPNQMLGLQRVGIGEIDFIGGLGPIELRQIDPRRGIVAVRAPVGRWYALQWQVDRPPFDNAKLRRAIAHSIDRDRINQILMDGKGAVANGLSPQGLWWSNPTKSTFEYAPAKARQLFDEAKWSMDQPMTLWAPGDAYYNKISQLVAEQLTAVGVKLTMSPVVQSEYYARVVQRSVNFTPTTWGQRADPDGLFYYLLHSKGGGNTTGYSSPEVDSRLEQARTSSDVAERRRLYGEVEALMMQDLPYIPLIFGADYMAISDKVRNFTPSPDTFPRFRSVWKAAP